MEFYKDELIKLDYQAFYWEHPALTNELLEKEYECIIQRSRHLEHLPINENAFKKFLHKNERVVDFMNLGKNARLVIPQKKQRRKFTTIWGNS